MKKKQFLIWLLIILILFSVFIYFNTKRKEHFSLGSQEVTFTRNAINADTRKSVKKLQEDTASSITLSDIQASTSINEYVEDNKISVEDLSYLLDGVDVDNYCKNDDNCDSDKMCYNNIIQIGDDNNLTFGNINVLGDISLDGWEGYLDFATTNQAVNDGICINKPDTPIIYPDRMTETEVKTTKQNIINYIIQIDRFLKDRNEVYFLDNTFFTIIKLKINELDFRTIKDNLDINKISSFYNNISNLLISLNYHITENIFKFLIYILERIDELKVNINEDAYLNNLLNLTKRINDLRKIIFNNETIPDTTSMTTSTINTTTIEQTVDDDGKVTTIETVYNSEEEIIPPIITRITDSSGNIINTNYGRNIYMERVGMLPLEYDTAIDNAINHLEQLKELLDGLLYQIEYNIPGYTYEDYLNQISSLRTYIVSNRRRLLEFKNQELVDLSKEMDQQLLFLKGKLEDYITYSGAMGGGTTAVVTMGGVGVSKKRQRKKFRLAEDARDRIEKEKTAIDDEAIKEYLLEVLKAETTEMKRFEESTKFKDDVKYEVREKKNKLAEAIKMSKNPGESLSAEEEELIEINDEIDFQILSMNDIPESDVGVKRLKEQLLDETLKVIVKEKLRDKHKAKLEKCRVNPTLNCTELSAYRTILRRIESRTLQKKRAALYEKSAEYERYRKMGFFRRQKTLKLDMLFEDVDRKIEIQEQYLAARELDHDKKSKKRGKLFGGEDATMDFQGTGFGYTAGTIEENGSTTNEDIKAKNKKQLHTGLDEALMNINTTERNLNTQNVILDAVKKASSPETNANKEKRLSKLEKKVSDLDSRISILKLSRNRSKGKKAEKIKKRIEELKYEKKLITIEAEEISIELKKGEELGSLLSDISKLKKAVAEAEADEKDKIQKKIDDLETLYTKLNNTRIKRITEEAKKQVKLTGVKVNIGFTEDLKKRLKNNSTYSREKYLEIDEKIARLLRIAAAASAAREKYEQNENNINAKKKFEELEKEETKLKEELMKLRVSSTNIDKIIKRGSQKQEELGYKEISALDKRLQQLEKQIKEEEKELKRLGNLDNIAAKQARIEVLKEDKKEVNKQLTDFFGKDTNREKQLKEYASLSKGSSFLGIQKTFDTAKTFSLRGRDSLAKNNQSNEEKVKELNAEINILERRQKKIITKAANSILFQKEYESLEKELAELIGKRQKITGSDKIDREGETFDNEDAIKARKEKSDAEALKANPLAVAGILIGTSLPVVGGMIANTTAIQDEKKKGILRRREKEAAIAARKAAALEIGLQKAEDNAAADDNGTLVNAAGANGTLVNAAGDNGTRVNAASANGTRVNAASANGTRVNAAGAGGRQRAIAAIRKGKKQLKGKRVK